MKRWILFGTVSVVIVVSVLSMTVFRDFLKATFYIGHMESDERIDHMKIDSVVKSLSVKPGDAIADIGAGSGLFSRRFASSVTPSGTVFSVDINKHLLEHIDNVNKSRGINNIKTIVAGENDPMLPRKVDLIFMCDTLHYINKQEQYIATMARYLNANGRIAVISFKGHWPPLANKFTENDLAKWMKKSGLEPVKTEYFIQGQYLAIYKKK